MNAYEPFLTPAVKQAIVKHTLEDREVEACGLITLSNGDYSYERCQNVDEEPDKRFKFDNATRDRVMLDPTVVAYVHSHPKGENAPSKHDMITQAHVCKPSVICVINGETGAVEIFSFGDHVSFDAPLIGRVFRASVLDCYEAIRGWWWQERGVMLDPFPRDPEWYDVGGQQENTKLEDNEDMYLRNFASQGFIEFTPDLKNKTSPDHPQVGDCLLMQIAAPVINHAAVYVGNNLIYHHRTFRRSGKNPIGFFMDQGYIRKWLRRE